MSLIDHYAADMDWTELCDGRDAFDPIECAECAECAGSGLYRRATWAEPEEPCPHCDGTGLIDCNCPGLCRYQEPSEPIDTSGWRNPWDVWANYTEPPF